MAKKIKLSIIIPAFNEAKRLPKRFPNAYKYLKNNFKSFELILVNDGSKDDTERVMGELSKGRNNIKVVSYQPNKGKGYAVKKGVELAKGEIIGFTDADFAIHLDKLSQVLAEFQKNADIVIGDRKTKEAKLENKPDLLRRVLSITHSRVNNFFLKLGPIRDTLCGFKFFKAPIAKKLFNDLTIYRWFFDLEILIRARNSDYKIVQLPVSWEEIRGSKVTYISMIKSSLKEHLTIYGHFFNLKIFSALTIGLLILLFLPFWLGPQNLTQRNGDYSDLVWPNYFFIKQTILTYHQIPLWNPTLFSGIPEIANPQSPLIYPPNILALILPIDYAIIILVIIHAFLGGIFLYKIGKEIFNFSPLATVVLAYAYIFSPFVVSKIAVGHLSMVFAIYLVGPIIYFALKLLTEIKIKNILLLAIFLGGQYLNYPTIWYYTLFFGLPILVGFSFLKNKWKYILVIFLSILISLLLISPILLLQLQAGPLITRSSLNINDLSIPIWSLKRFISSTLIPSNFLADNETEVWLFPGIFTLISAFLGFWKLDNKFKLVFLGILGLVVLLTLGSRTPVFGLFNSYIPGFSYLRVVTRDWFIFIITIAFLSSLLISKIRKYQLILGGLILIELFIFSTIRLWSVPEVMSYATRQSPASLLKSDENYRYYCTSRCLSARETVPRGVNTADGYHLLILKDYRLALSDAGGFAPPEYTGNLPTFSVAQSQPSANKLGHMAIKWVVSNYPLQDPKLIKIKTDADYMLYENTEFKERIYFKNLMQNQITIKKDTPNQIVFKTLGSGGVLIMADSYYPGWEAFIDDKITAINKEDGWARSIKVPSGEHEIQFEFKPFNNLIRNVI